MPLTHLGAISILTEARTRRLRSPRDDIVGRAGFLTHIADWCKPGSNSSLFGNVALESICPT